MLRLTSMVLTCLLFACPAFCWTISAPVASTSQDSLDPRVAADASGKAHVVWRERVGGTTFQIWYTANVEGPFASPTQISQGGSIHCYWPVVATCGSDVHTAWASDQTGSNFEIWYRKKSGPNWGAIYNGSNTSIKSLRPALAVSGIYGPVLTWDEALYADDNYDVLFSEWIGSGFGNSVNVSNTPGGSVYGSVNSNVAISPNSDVTVVWAERISGDYHINARRKVGGIWHARQEISTKQTGPSTPGIAAGPDNQVHVIYAAEDRLWYQRWTGSSWTPPDELPSGSGVLLRPKIAVDSRGVAHVVADNSSYGIGEIFYTNNASGGWGPWENISNTPNTNSLAPDIACNGDVLTAVWHDNSNQAGGTGVFNIWYARRGLVGTPSPVTSFSITPADRTNRLYWTNPWSDSFTGTMIRCRTDRYPTGPADGVLVCDRAASPGSSDSFVHTGLTNGVTYYYSAFAHDNSGHYSPGVGAQGTPNAWTIAYAKTQPDKTSAELNGKIVTAVFGSDSCIYIEEADRSSGIRVATTQTGLAVGDIVNVSGSMDTRKPDGVNAAERQVVATSIVKAGSGTPLEPISMVTRDIGGEGIPPYVPGVLGGIGLNNIGLLVQVAGRVSYKVTSYIYVDDGWKVPDISGRYGVMVRCPSSTIPVEKGDMVKVTGIVEGSMPSGWTTNRRYLHIRDWNDLVKVN